MPYVNIRITREDATPEQKAELISGVTGLLVEVLGKEPATTHIVIDEIELDNWGVSASCDLKPAVPDCPTLLSLGDDRSDARFLEFSGSVEMTANGAHC